MSGIVLIRWGLMIGVLWLGVFCGLFLFLFHAIELDAFEYEGGY